MVNDKAVPGKCNAEIGGDRRFDEDSGYCPHEPVADNGRCKLHGGVVGDDVGPPEGTVNNEVHGLFSDNDKYYQRMPKKSQLFIERLYESFLESAPFGEESEGKAALLWEIAVNHHKRRRADGKLAEDGLLRDQVFVSDDGEKFVDRDGEEHPVHMVYDRLARTDIRRLRDLGVLDDPGSRVGGGLESLAEVLSEE